MKNSSDCLEYSKWFCTELCHAPFLNLADNSKKKLNCTENTSIAWCFYVIILSRIYIIITELREIELISLRDSFVNYLEQIREMSTSFILIWSKWQE